MVILSASCRAPEGQAPLKPLRVGFYDIEGTLGKGNFAVVKLARHRVTKTQVAIKIIDKTRLDAGDLEKVYREARIMKLMRHPHILKLYQVMETKDMLYIVTEFARNGEMFDYLTSHGRLSEEEARRKFWQILSAVEYCHEHHIVHRDLKTENLLLDANMDIKLADFGFGNFYQPGEPLSTWCGSPPYAAPEVFAGKEYEGPQLDVWSLGVVLYVLVCGSLPFDGPSLPALRQRVLEGRFRVPFFISRDCEALLHCMLALDPAKRITVAQIWQHRWMLADPALRPPRSSQTHGCSSVSGGYSEQVLGFMQGLGVDRQRTLESLHNSSYNHAAAMYYLLLDRLQELRGDHLSGRLPSAPQPRSWSGDLSSLEVPQEGLTAADAFPAVLLCPQPQALGPAFLQDEVDCQLRDSLQPPLFPVDVSLGGPVAWPRCSSPGRLMDPEDDAEAPGPPSPCHRHTLAEVSAHCPPCGQPCIVISASPASESTSSDSCLPYLASEGPGVPSGHLAAQELLGTCSPLRLASPLLGTQSATPVLEAPGGPALHPVSFQEGRRASDTSLTQGLRAFRQQLRRSLRGLLGLSKVKGLGRQPCPSSTSPWAPLPVAAPGSGLLEGALHQQRWLQLQHHPAPPSCHPSPPGPPPVPAPAPRDTGVVCQLPGAPLVTPALLPSALLPAGVSAVASAAHLLDAHLPLGEPLGPALAPRLPAGLPRGDCAREALGPPGPFVLVQ